MSLPHMPIEQACHEENTAKCVTDGHKSVDRHVIMIPEIRVGEWAYTHIGDSQ